MSLKRAWQIYLGVVTISLLGFGKALEVSGLDVAVLEVSGLTRVPDLLSQPVGLFERSPFQGDMFS